MIVYLVLIGVEHVELAPEELDEMTNWQIGRTAEVAPAAVVRFVRRFVFRFHIQQRRRRRLRRRRRDAEPVLLPQAKRAIPASGTNKCGCEYYINNKEISILR